MLPRQGLEQLFYLFGIVPARFTHPDWAAYVGFPVDGYWTVLTYQFLHGGWLHLIANMWTLWIFGDNVEDQMGSLRFVIFYLICGRIAGLTQVADESGFDDSIDRCLGRDRRRARCVSDVFSDSATRCSASDLLFSVLFRGPGRALSCPLVLHSICLAAQRRWPVRQEVGGIAWWAHVGGFVSGMLLCRLFARRRRQLQPDEVRTGMGVGTKISLGERRI